MWILTPSWPRCWSPANRRAGRFRPVMRMYQPRQVVQASELSVPRTTTHAH
jgi:hypothetical protein